MKIEKAKRKKLEMVKKKMLKYTCNIPNYVYGEKLVKFYKA